MVKKCILCHFKNNENAIDTTCKSNLICRLCQTLNVSSYSISKHDPSEAKADEKNKPTAITCTLMPKYHHVDDETVHEWYRKVSKEIIRSFRTPSYIHGVAEYTKNGVYHLHIAVFARPRIIAKLSSRYRKLGHVMVKPIHDLEKWTEYMYKEYDDDIGLPPFKIVS